MIHHTLALLDGELAKQENPSRGVVATQFGLPLPAFRKALCVVLEVFLASLISSSLISNGLKAAKFCSVKRSAMAHLAVWRRDREVETNYPRSH